MGSKPSVADCWARIEAAKAKRAAAENRILSEVLAGFLTIVKGVNYGKK